MVGERGGIVKASDEDVEFLARAAAVGGDNGGDPVQVAAGLGGAYGLSLAVITLGPDGGAAIEPGGGQTACRASRQRWWTRSAPGTRSWRGSWTAR